MQHVKQIGSNCDVAYFIIIYFFLKLYLHSQIQLALRGDYGKNHIKIFKIFASNGWMEKTRSPFFWICRLNQFNSSKNRMYLIGHYKSNTPGRCSLWQCLIFLFWLRTADNNNYRVYLISGTLNLRWGFWGSLNKYSGKILWLQFWVFLRNNTWNAMCLLPLRHTQTLAHSHTERQGITEAHLSVLVCERCFPTTRLERICAPPVTLKLTTVWFIAQVSS